MQAIPTAPIHVSKQKLLWLAGLLSFILPGAGLFYLRRSFRGVAWLGTYAIAIVAFSRFGRGASQVSYLFYVLLAAIAVGDTVRVGQLVEQGKLQRESSRSTLVALGAAVGIVVAAVGVFVFSGPPIARAPAGTILFAQSVDDKFQMSGESDHFAPGATVAYAARLRHVLDAGDHVSIVISKPSDAGEVVLLRQETAYPGRGDLLRSTLLASTAGTYRLQIISGNGVEAEGSFFIGSFN